MTLAYATTGACYPSIIYNHIATINEASFEGKYSVTLYCRQQQITNFVDNNYKL
jgi:hypothetical protein